VFCALQDNVVAVLTFVAPAAGAGENGDAGGSGLAIVVKDQTGPAVVPAAFLAVTRQKYVVAYASGAGEPSAHSHDGVYDALAFE
jgi:hypothetical protein